MDPRFLKNRDSIKSSVVMLNSPPPASSAANNSVMMRGAVVPVAPSVGKWYFLRWSIQEQTLFIKRLAVFIKAGVPISTGLNMLHSQATSKKAKHILGHIQAKVEGGALLSTGMRTFVSVFGDFCVSVIGIGEASGTLDENLNYLAEELKKKQELRRRVVSALVYPAIICVATIGIALLLTVYVFPKIMPIFQSFRFELPWSTRLLIFISNGLRNNWMAIVLSLVVVIVLMSFLLRRLAVQRIVHRQILRVPLLGRLILCYQVANFTRTLGLLLRSDIRIIEAMRMVGSTTGNVAYKEQFKVIAEIVNKGEKISEAMARDPLLFPPIVTQMIAVGESTGKLSDSLSYLGVMYEDELKNLTTNLSTVVEPVLMVFMGLLVGFIAISIITPIYGITQNIHP